MHVRLVEGVDGPGQVVNALADWPLAFVDVSEESDPFAAGQTWMADAMQQPMDLMRRPLFSYALVKLSSDRFLWYQGYHHVVTDWVGVGLIAQRVAETYSALADNRIPGLSTLGSLQQLVESDLAYRTSKHFTEDRDYWLGRFGDLPDPTRLVGRSSGITPGFLRRTGVLPMAGDRIWPPSIPEP